MGTVCCLCTNVEAVQSSASTSREMAASKTARCGHLTTRALATIVLVEGARLVHQGVDWCCDCGAVRTVRAGKGAWESPQKAKRPR